MEDDVFNLEFEEDIEDISIEDNFGDLDIDEINEMFTRSFTINPTLWTDAVEINSHMSIDDFNELKYVRNDLSYYDEEVNNLPDNKGGLYFFI